MNATERFLLPAMILVLALPFLAPHVRSPQPADGVPGLPVMGTIGLGILLGGIVIGAILYLWKRPR